MRKIHLPVIFLIAASVSGYTQKFAQWWDPKDENIDSLRKVLSVAQGTARVDCLNELGFAYCGFKIDSTLYYITAAFNEAQKVNYKRGMAMSSFYKAQFPKDSAEEELHISEAIAYAKKANDKRLEGFSYALAGWFYPAHGNMDRGLYFISLLDSLATKTKDEMLLANVYYLRSNIYIGQGKLYEGLQLQVKLNQLHLLGDEQRANNLHGIARTYTALGDYQTAVYYYQQSIDYRKQHNQLPDWGNFTEIHFCYVQLKKYDSALLYLNYGIALTDVFIKDPVSRLAAKTEYRVNKALLFDNIQQYDSAKYYYDLCLVIYKKANQEYMVPRTQLYLGRIYFTEKQYAKSFELAKQALQVAEKFNFTALLIDAYFLLADLYGHYKNYDKAYYYLHQYTLLKKPDPPPTQVYNNLTFYKSAIENEKKQSQIQLLSRNAKLQAEAAKRQRLLFFASLAGVLLLLVLAIVLVRSNRLKHRSNIQLTQLNEEIGSQKQTLEVQKKDLEKALSELRSTQALLIQSEKMASLGELTAGIAHEIQNPLNFVNNFSDVSVELVDEMNEELEKGDIEEAKFIAADIKENLEKINHHGKRADAIVRGMLQHSKTGKGQRELTNINALCDEYLKLGYHGMRAKEKDFVAELKTDFDKSIGKINLVPQDMGRVLQNLFNNAFYAVNEKNMLSANGYHAVTKVSTHKLNDKIEIRVEDNGNGIPEKIVDKIFQPFFTTKPTGQGTGLGLSLSYDIIKAHGGEIKVKTKEGEGSEFIIQLPIT